MSIFKTRTALLSFDIVNLFTSIPVEEVIRDDSVWILGTLTVAG
jgi:hypothetical protein